MSGLDGDQGRRAWKLLEAAHELPAKERSAFLRAQCVDDPTLAERLVRSIDASVDASDVSSVGYGVSETHEPMAARPIATLPIGAILDGRYEVLEESNRGGMGTVFRGRHLELDQSVAIKVLPRGHDVEAMVEEGRRIADVTHRSVVRVMDVGIHQSTPFLVMEWLDGFDLRAWLTNARDLGAPAREGVDTALASYLNERNAVVPYATSYWRFVATIMRDVARAVASAHSANVVHQDISPKNIVITREGRAALVDFGLSTLLRPDDEAGARRRGGTWPYMAPEHRAARAGTSLEANDVYGLGATLLHLVTGESPDRIPWPARGFRSPRRFGEASARGAVVPIDLLRVAWKATHPEPIERYRSAASFADDLDAFLGYRPVSVQAPGLGRRVALWWRRSPGRATAVMLAPVTLVAIGAVAHTTWTASEARALASDQDAAHKIFVKLPTMWGLNADMTLPPAFRAREPAGTRDALGELLSLSPEMDSLRVRRAMLAAQSNDLETVALDMAILRRRHPRSELLPQLERDLLSSQATLVVSPEPSIDVGLDVHATAVDCAIAAIVCFQYRKNTTFTVAHAREALRRNPADIATRELLILEAGLTRGGVPGVDVDAELRALAETLDGKDTAGTLHVRAYRIRSKDEARARSYWRESLALSPHQYQPRHSLVWLDLKEDVTEGRTAMISQFIDERPGIVQNRTMLARCLRQLDDYDGASRAVLDAYETLAPLARSRPSLKTRLEELVISQVTNHALHLAYDANAWETTVRDPMSPWSQLNAIARVNEHTDDEALLAVPILCDVQDRICSPRDGLEHIKPLLLEAIRRAGLSGSRTDRAAYVAEACLLCMRSLQLSDVEAQLAEVCVATIAWNSLATRRYERWIDASSTDD